MNDIFVKIDGTIKSFGSSTDPVYTKEYTPIIIDTEEPKIIPIKSYTPVLLHKLYFEVNKLFSELSTDYDKAKARNNLGIDEIIDEIKDSTNTTTWKIIKFKTE